MKGSQKPTSPASAGSRSAQQSATKSGASSSAKGAQAREQQGTGRPQLHKKHYENWRDSELGEDQQDAIPTFPRILKLAKTSTHLKRDVEPEDYLAAISELLFITICISYLITYLHDPSKLEDNPIINMVGYNNPCAFWDQPPALYFASAMFCPMVYLGFRYAALDTVRARLTPHVKYQGACRFINFIYAASQSLIMGIFIITPHPKGTYLNETLDDMHWNMRVHSACFLQFVPVLCITMTANYIEGYMSGHPKSMPSKRAWAGLIFYVIATTLETIFATYAIMFYEGNYEKGTTPSEIKFREDNYKVPPWFMMTVDYCWFFSLPIAASMQPPAPNIYFKYELEEEYTGLPSTDYDVEEVNDGKNSVTRTIDEDNDNEGWCGRCFIVLLCVLAFVVPIIACLHWLRPETVVPVPVTNLAVFGFGAGVPFLIICILLAPVSKRLDPHPFDSSLTGFKLNEAQFGWGNYFSRLLSFAGAAKESDFRPSYGPWFADQTMQNPNIATQFGGNTRMFYGWADCKEKLSNMGPRILSNVLKRESELALVVLNNLMWPDAGRFALGYSNDDHAFVRPYLAQMFDNGQYVSWSLESLRDEFAHHMSKLQSIDHNLVTRNLFDVVDPAKSKTIITQLVIKVLHKVALGMEINDEQAAELAALQTMQLMPASMSSRIARSLCCWYCVGGPTRSKLSWWIDKYKPFIEQKYPTDHWTPHRLTLLASAFLDAMTQAGGRSVPLAIDLCLGYMLSKHRPPCMVGVDFQQPANIRKLMFECMRYHPPVTVFPYWVRGNGPQEPDWVHELVCLDRALADPQVFPNPDEFLLNRSNNESASMAWGDFAVVDNNKAHPHSHMCPGKELSIAMVQAFILEYQAAGPWQLASSDIKFNYYGSKGFKLTKAT